MDPSFSVSHRIQVPPLRKTCTSYEYAEECISSYNTQGDIASSVAAIHSAVQRTPLPANPLLSLCAASRRLEAALELAFSDDAEAAADPPVLSEPWVARHLCSQLVGDEQVPIALLRAQCAPTLSRTPTAGHSSSEPSPQAVLFASNSLPIRHLETYCAGVHTLIVVQLEHPTHSSMSWSFDRGRPDYVTTGVPTILCNRGASGIDGILHTALGASLGNAGKCKQFVTREMLGSVAHAAFRSPAHLSCPGPNILPLLLLLLRRLKLHAAHRGPRLHA